MSNLKNVKRKDFELTKAKIAEKGVSAEFLVTTTTNGVKSKVKFTAESDEVPHPATIQARDALKEPLMRSLLKYKVFEEAMKYLKGDQKKKVTDVFLDLVNNTEVTGISLSGLDQMKGAIISGKEMNAMEGNSAINSPRIVFSSDKLGFEKQVQDLATRIEDEVFKYLFENHRAQLDIFDDTGQGSGKRKMRRVKETAENGS